MTTPDTPTLQEKLVKENAELRKELLNQWEYNHAEHCGHLDAHDECHWPMPRILLYKVGGEEIQT